MTFHEPTAGAIDPKARLAFAGLEIVPPGVPLQYFGSVAPEGFEFIYGQVRQKHLQPKLFNAIGTAFNTGGEGADEFRWPDARDVVLVGLGNMGGNDRALLSAANTLGLQFGSGTHTLTGAQSGTSVHGHTATQESHDHAYGYNNVSRTDAGDLNAFRASDDQPGSDGDSQTDSETPAITVANSSAANAAEAHPIVQPTLYVNVIMRAA